MSCRLQASGGILNYMCTPVENKATWNVAEFFNSYVFCYCGLAMEGEHVWLWIGLADDKDRRCLPFSYSFKSTITVSSPIWVMVYVVLTNGSILVTAIPLELFPLASVLPWNWVLKTACSLSHTDISFVKWRQTNWSELLSKINETIFKKQLIHNELPLQCFTSAIWASRNAHSAGCLMHSSTKKGFYP